ncbi:MAG TPA: hypothetical protein VF970_15425 [Gemmatimonadales bacterium]
MRQFFLGMLFAATLAPRAGAQWLRDLPGQGPTALGLRVDTVAARSSVAGPVLGGILGGSVGLVAGAFVGGSLAEGGLGSWRGCANEDLGCLLGSILIGAAIGEAALLPVGAHLGGGRRGRFAQELLVSAGIAALGVAATAATVEPAFLIPVPILQLWAVTLLERRTQ